MTGGIVASSGIAFFGMSEIIGSLGPWSALIGGVLLIITTLQNPEGIAGAIRTQAAEKRAKQQSVAAAQQRPATAVLS